MISLMGPWCECGVNEASLSSHLLGKPSNVTNVTLFEVWDPPCDCCSMEPSDVNRRVRSRFDISENPQRIPVWHPAKPQRHIDTSLQHAKLEHSSPRFSQILPDRPYAPSLTMKWRNMSATPRGFCGDSWNPIGRPSPIKNHQMVFLNLFLYGETWQSMFSISWVGFIMCTESYCHLIFKTKSPQKISICSAKRVKISFVSSSTAWGLASIRIYAAQEGSPGEVHGFVWKLGTKNSMNSDQSWVSHSIPVRHLRWVFVDLKKHLHRIRLHWFCTGYWCDCVVFFSPRWVGEVPVDLQKRVEHGLRQKFQQEPWIWVVRA